MKLEAGVSELDAGRLVVGMSARLTTQAHPGQTFNGQLTAIAPEVDPRNRHFLIEVRVANPGATLLSGMYGAATISLERLSQVMTVPRDAVTTRDGRRVALRVNDATIEEVPVHEGLNNGDMIEITSGLDTGDTIVADARNELPAGSPVNAIVRK